jgi:hypothetical protein
MAIVLRPLWGVLFRGRRVLDGSANVDNARNTLRQGKLFRNY